MSSNHPALIKNNILVGKVGSKGMSDISISNSILDDIDDDDDFEDSELDITVTKRDGSTEDYEESKVSHSIMSAAIEVGGEDYDLADRLAQEVTDRLEEADVTEVTTDQLEKFIKDVLIDDGHSSTAEAYILYAADRHRVREMDSDLMHEFEEITFSSSENSDMKRENANINSETAMGMMLKFGSESAKKFNLAYLISPDIAAAHRNGDIHIHDLDFYSMTETCCQVPLDKLFKHGFNTGHGFLREPGSIRSASALTAIAIQSDQNDQHGGQSIPLLDYYLAPYVALSYIREIVDMFRIKLDLTDEQAKALKYKLKKYWRLHTTLMPKQGELNEKLANMVIEFLDSENIEYTEKQFNSAFGHAWKHTYDDTYQAMEALIHNLNTLHSRAGSQVPFSSVNLGTDTTVEGRFITETLLLSTEQGLGNGETPIFPISIFKLKAGVNFNKEDPNYDLFKLACRVSAKRLYPNFVNEDAPYNASLYKEGHPETEMATMGCRTRVGSNTYKPECAVIPGRGNLSFTSINLPRLGILADHDITKFYALLDDRLELVHKELLERFEVQCMRHPRNFPFLMGQGVWLDTDKLGPDDDIREVLKHGTLSVGFIGLAETLVALIGKHHGESEEAQKLGLEIVQHMRNATDKWSKEEHMNYSILGTPAEGLSGRFVKMDREKFGRIQGVTDKEYYTNSSHVPVWYKISAFKKIDIEAPYHEIENAGHILYIEMDGDPTKNLDAFEKVVRYMHDKNAGYFAINHPVDRDPICGYVGIIGDTCPRCGRREGMPMTPEMWGKIKGYATAGNASNCGACGDENEEADRMINDTDTK